MKRKYQKSEIEIIEFEEEDVITTSTGDDVSTEDEQNGTEDDQLKLSTPLIASNLDKPEKADKKTVRWDLVKPLDLYAR